MRTFTVIATLAAAGFYDDLKNPYSWTDTASQTTQTLAARKHSRGLALLRQARESAASAESDIVEVAELAGAGRKGRAAAAEEAAQKGVEAAEKDLTEGEALLSAAADDGAPLSMDDEDVERRAEAAVHGASNKDDAVRERYQNLGPPEYTQQASTRAMRKQTALADFLKKSHRRH